MSTKNITRYLGSIFLLLSLTTQNAYAEGFDLFKPSDDNWLIKHIFLQLFYPDVSPLGPISEVFLAGILAFGGILAGYTMLAGTLHTANDGEMLGKKWSSLWIPIRTTLGVSMILPIKGGFCAIQLVLIWIAVQGIGLADQTWSAFAENPLKGSVVPQPYIDKQVKELYKAGVMGYACLAAIQKDQDENEADAKSGDAANLLI
ncbi:DotA/TraY family protein [Salmonella enterica subsp. enterica]|nr:DotA/TraY family protein [Salmonella enterica subsp. enterica serovar Altona]